MVALTGSCLVILGLMVTSTVSRYKKLGDIEKRFEDIIDQEPNT